ncbi:MAG: DUF362 domain-containing protein [Bacteroidales bacterium]
MKRRDFLRNLGLAGAATILPAQGLQAITHLTSLESETTPDLIALMGGTPEMMLAKAIGEAGGIGKYVKKGDKVVIKPNIGWDKAPEMAANTNPQLVGALVSMCMAAGAKEVLVFDHTCDNWKASYANSGIENAVRDAGGKMIPGNDEGMYQEINLPNAVTLKQAKVHKAILDCDVWFNMPVLKNHGGPKMTVSMKNLMGIVWDRRFFHANNLHQCIADIATIKQKPVLNIVDAYRTMKTNGPQGKGLADVVETKALFLSKDMVAVDTAAIKFFSQIREMNLDDVQYLAMAQTQKVGTMDLASLNVKRIKL